MSNRPHVTPDPSCLRAELTAHGERAWFDASKASCRSIVREPLPRFLAGALGQPF